MPEPVSAALHLTVTRRRLRWTRPFVLVQFLRLSLRNARAVQTSPGFLGGALRVDARLTFWTVTRWRDVASMRAYAGSPVHIAAMKHLREHANAYTEAAFASGASPTPHLPTTPQARAFLTAHATFYDLPRASGDQRARRVQAPKVRAVRRLEPNRA